MSKQFYTLLICFVCLLTSISGYAKDNHLLDSLQDSLRNTGYDTTKVIVLLKLSSATRRDNIQSSRVYAMDALKLAKDLDYKKGIATSFHFIGIIYDEQSNYVSALEYYNLALEVRLEIKDNKGIASSYNNIGLIYINQNNFKTGLEYYFKSLKIKESIGDKKGIAKTLNNIGVVYRKQDNFEKALEYYLKAQQLLEDINDQKGIARNLNNIGTIYYYEEEYDKAIDYLLQSLDIRKKLGDKYGIANNFNNIAGIYFKQENLSKALEYQFKALKIYDELDFKKGVVYSYNNIGGLYTKMDNHQLALVYSTKSLRLAKEIKSREDEKLAYLNLSEIHAAMKDFDNAYRYHLRYSGIADSILQEENRSNIAELEARYQSEKKEKEIELLQKKEALQKVKIDRDRILIYAFSAGFFLIFILGLVVLRGYKNKQKANTLLASQNEEIINQKDIIEEKSIHILDSIEYAKRIQQAILPPENFLQELFPPNERDPNKSGEEGIFVLYRPKDIVSGDFYWTSPTSSQAVLLAAVDCTGHGVPGAFMSIVGHNHLNQAVREKGLSKPADILNFLNECVIETLHQKKADGHIDENILQGMHPEMPDRGFKQDEAVKDGMDIALCSLTLSPEDESTAGHVEFAGANNPLYLFRNGELLITKGDNRPIGAYDITTDTNPFTNHEIELQKGDILYIFSDGFADQFGGPKGKKFKYSNFKNLLLSIADKPMTEQKEILNQTFNDWRGKYEQVDDICVIGVRV